MIKNLFIRALIPLVIMGGIAVMLYYQGDFENAKSTFIVGLIISIVASASLIYDQDHWSIFKRSILHFIVMLVLIFPLLLVSGWFEVNTWNQVTGVLLIFMGVGVILWSIFMVLAKVFKW